MSMNNKTAEGVAVSASAAGTNAEGKECQRKPPIGDTKPCVYASKDPKPKYQNPQWLCYEGIREVVDWIRERTQIVPQVAIMSGRGLGGIEANLDDKVVFKYSEIPHFHVVEGQSDAAQQMVIGKLGRKRIVILMGRFPPYEGFHYGVSSMPVRVVRQLGATHFINLNTVSTLSTNFHVGDFVVIQDHVNLPAICGLNPLKGPNDDRLGPRFPDLTCVYDRELRQLFHEAVTESLEKQSTSTTGSKTNAPRVKDAVASLVSGPAFLTPAECHAMKTLGVDVVGMSGAHENLVATHAGMKVLGISIVARRCSLKEDQPPADEEKNKELVVAKAENLITILDYLIKSIDLI